MSKKVKTLFFLIVSALIILSACGSNTDTEVPAVTDSAGQPRTDTTTEQLPTSRDSASMASVVEEILFEDSRMRVVVRRLPMWFDMISDFHPGGIAETITLIGTWETDNFELYQGREADLLDVFEAISVGAHPPTRWSFEYERGFINRYGEIIPMPQFDDMVAFGLWSEGLLGVVRHISTGDGHLDYEAMLGFVNERGEIVIPFEYPAINPFGHAFNYDFPIPMFQGGVARMVIKDEGQPVIGVIDRNRNTVIPFQYSQNIRGDSIEVLSNGYILIFQHDGGRWNYLLYNSSGNRVIEFDGVPIWSVWFVGDYIITWPPGGMSGSQVFRADDYSFVLETSNQHEVEHLLRLSVAQQYISFEAEGMVQGVTDNNGNFIIEPGIYHSIDITDHLIFADVSEPLNPDNPAGGRRHLHTNIYDIEGNILFEGVANTWQSPGGPNELIFVSTEGMVAFLNAYGEIVASGFHPVRTRTNNLIVVQSGWWDEDKLDLFLASDYTGDVLTTFAEARGDLQWAFIELIRFDG